MKILKKRESGFIQTSGSYVELAVWLILLVLGMAFAVYMFGYVLLIIAGELAYFIQAWIR